MNHIEQLIADLCPGGVRFVPLADLEDTNVVKLGRGKVISKKTLFDNPGPYPVYSSSGLSTGKFGTYGEFMFEDERITWSIDGGGRFFHRPSHRYSVTNVSGWLKVLDESTVCTKFLFYVLDNAWLGMSFDYTRKAHPSVIRNEYLIPLPPLEVQWEIVRILDKFTQLEAELEAELEARQKQYDHYKKQLLSIPKEVPRVPLGTIADVFGGAPFESRYFNEVSEGVPLVRIRDINTGFSGTYYSGPFEERYKVEDGDMLISMDGDFKAVRWTHGPAVLNQRVCRLQNFQDDIDPDYVFYLVRKGIKRIQGSTYASTVKHLSAKQIRAIEIPLLPLSEQRNVSGTLKLLDMMISDHIDGLPAEILARRRQYEFYRDRLLTFKELAP